jgi:hypothetical protein
MGFWDGSTPAMRLGFFGFCGALTGVVIRVGSLYLESMVLAYLSYVVMLISLAVAFWAILFAKHG